MYDYAKYEGLPFMYGVADCFSLLKTVYAEQYGIELKEYARFFGWEQQGLTILDDHYKDLGFRLVDDIPQEGDVFLMALRSKTPNHIALYVGGGNILHHMMDQPSKIELYKYRGVTTHHLRHKDLKLPEPPKEEIHMKDYLPADLKWRIKDAVA